MAHLFRIDFFSKSGNTEEKFKFNVDKNENENKKRNGGSDLQGAASRPPCRFPRSRFRFRFRFDLRRI